MDTKRFHNPEYKRQIKAVRTYRRQVKAAPETKTGKFLKAVGLGSVANKLLLFLLIAGIVYLSFFAKFLWITNAEINGVDEATKISVKENLDKYTATFKNFLPQKNILFFSPKGFSAYLLEQNKDVAKVVSLEKGYWHSIKINLEQRVASFTLSVNGKYYILNSDGTVGKEILTPEPTNLIDDQEAGQNNIEAISEHPLLVDLSPEDVFEGQQFFNEEQNNFLKYINEHFENTISLSIKNYVIPARAANQLTVIADNGLKIFFTNIYEPEKYLARLNAMWLELSDQDRARLAYLDLRFEKNAYGCYQGDPCASNN